MLLVAMMRLGSAGHEDQAQHGEDDGLDKTHEELEGKEGHVRNRKQECHHKQQDLPGKDIAK
jgi:hypothetical protein